jgi:hypothetical protein
MSAPTEAEIRAAIESCSTRYSNHGSDRLNEAITEYADDLRWRAGDLDLVETDPGREDRGSLWRDLRPSEDARLRELLYQAEQRATKASHELIIREYVTAMLSFLAEFPETPTREAAAAA